jgi:hypothetical protein
MKITKHQAALELDGRIAELAKRARLDGWTSFVEALQVPAELAPAIMTGRVELLKITPTRDYSAAEVAVLFKLIGALMETNAALREHAQEVAHLVDNWASAFKTLAAVGAKVEKFANFRHDQIGEESE